MSSSDALFSQHRHGVFRYLSRFVAHPDTAHDLTQEVFLRVARSRVPETTPVGCKAWVYTIARNVALNHIRDRSRRPQLVEFADAERQPTQEISVALQEALAALPEIEREIFLLREAAGLTYGEIGAACDLSVDAVRSRLHRAREQLRATLDATMTRQRQQGIRLRGDQV